jgi:hypothetical protein
MKEDYERKNSPDEVSDLLKTLIEVELRQHELLARLSGKLDTAICVLEHISKNTCETLNEAHEQTALQRSRSVGAERMMMPTAPSASWAISSFGIPNKALPPPPAGAIT